MRTFLTACVILVLVGCASVAPNGNLFPYQAQSGSLTIKYVLPSDAQFIGPPHRSDAAFPSNRPYPLVALIAAVGWEFHREIPYVSMDLQLLKLSAPRFARPQPLSEWQAIFREERVSTLREVRRQNFRDRLGRDWQEATLQEAGRLAARSFIRPVGPDVLIVFHLKFAPQASDKIRETAISLQDRMLDVISVAEGNGATNDERSLYTPTDPIRATEAQPNESDRAKR